MLQRKKNQSGLGLGLQARADGWDLSAGPGAPGTGQLVGTQLGRLLGYFPQGREEQTPWLE